MQKLKSIKDKYLLIGVREDNIDFAIDAVSEGTKREFILETLTADYRGMKQNQAIELLEDLFEANGGEFKKENREGYSWGILMLIIGLLGAWFLISMITAGEWKFKLILISGVAALIGLIQGPYLLYKSFRGKYRDIDSPLEDE